MENKNPILVADKLFAILELLAQQGAMSLSEIKEHTGLNKSTIHRVLTSLSFLGYVHQFEENGKYELTLKVLFLSNRLIDSDHIISICKPYIQKLCYTSGETVHMVQMEGSEAVYVYKEESFQNNIQLVSRVGTRIPLYCSGVGRAMLADMSENQVEEIWNISQIKKHTDKTITSLDKLQKCLKDVQKQGYALDDEEHELGVRCVAVSIPDLNPSVKYAISISAPAIRMPKDRCVELSRQLLEVKRSLAAAIQ